MKHPMFYGDFISQSQSGTYTDFTVLLDYHLQRNNNVYPDFANIRSVNFQTVLHEAAKHVPALRDRRDSLLSLSNHRANLQCDPSSCHQCQIIALVLKICCPGFVNCYDNNGQTALHVAATPQCADILLSMGANPYMGDMQRRAPLIVAQQENRFLVAEMITNHMVKLGQERQAEMMMFVQQQPLYDISDAPAAVATTPSSQNRRYQQPNQEVVPISNRNFYDIGRWYNSYCNQQAEIVDEIEAIHMETEQWITNLSGKCDKLLTQRSKDPDQSAV